MNEPHGIPLPVLGLAGFGSMAAMRTCDAMVPALQQSFSIPAAQAAWTISAFAIAYGISQLGYGMAGDRFGKPRVIAFATLACGVAALAAAVATSFYGLALARVVMGASAGGVIPLALATIGDQVEWQRRQATLASLLTYTVGGMMTGTWMGGFITDWGGWRATFACTGGLLLLAGSLVAWHAGRHPAHRRQQARGSRLRSVLVEASTRKIFALAAIEGALVFGVLASIPNFLHKEFGLSLSAAGGVAALFGLGGLLYSGTARVLVRAGPASLPLIGGVLLLAAFTAIVAGGGWVLAAGACFVAGLGFYMLHGTLQAQATQLLPAYRGTVMSMFSCSLFLGQSAGVTAGMRAAEFNLTSPYFVLCGGVLLALGAAFTASLSRRSEAA